jgi:hypothetical protein
MFRQLSSSVAALRESMPLDMVEGGQILLFGRQSLDLGCRP